MLNSVAILDELVVLEVARRFNVRSDKVSLDRLHEFLGFVTGDGGTDLDLG